jgi:hypothetical protein
VEHGREYKRNVGKLEKVAEGVMRVAKKVVGASRGSMPEDKQTWWWAEEVQEIIISKKKYSLRIGRKSEGGRIG